MKPGIILIMLIVVAGVAIFLLPPIVIREQHTTTVETLNMTRGGVENVEGVVHIATNKVIEQKEVTVENLNVKNGDPRNAEDVVTIATNMAVGQKEAHTPLDSKEDAEYIQIARIRAKHLNIVEITDEVVPIVENRDDNIVVTFLFPPPEGVLPENFDGGSFEVIIDIKTKNVVQEIRWGS